MNSRILQTGRAGLDSIQNKMDTVAHNIANAQTNGYKTMEVQFEDLVYDRLGNKGTPITRKAAGKPVQIGTGSRVKTIQHRFDNGIPQETSRPFDLAIQGEGFFGVEGENGETLLTRDGAFSVDGSGQLVDGSGRHVRMDLFTPLTQWPAKDVIIDEKGYMTCSDPVTGQFAEIGKIHLYHATDPAMLIDHGDNTFFTERPEDIYEAGNRPGTDDSIIRQGFLEGSTVDMTKELTDMLMTQRAYQINTKSIHAADELWGMTNQLRR
jgi:flagellar basal-body rod protein FlgG